MDMPTWAARVWLKEQEIRIRKGEIGESKILNLKEKMQDIEPLIMSEESRKITKELNERGSEEEMDICGDYNETQTELLNPPKLVATDALGNKLFEMYVSPQISADFLRRYVPHLMLGMESGKEK